MLGVISGRFGLVATPIQTDADGRLIVRGQDQLFSFKRTLASYREGIVSDAGGWMLSHSPDEGYAWIVTNIAATDRTNATTEQDYSLIAAMGTTHFYRVTEAIPAATPMHWGGHLYLEHDDVVRVYFIGSLAGDTCRIELSGYEMTLEA